MLSVAITLKPVTILGFSIARSVGLGGANDPDDIFTIKTLLNGIAPEQGGADGTLDVTDLSNTSNSMEPLIDAIIVFQRLQPGLLHDGRVDPEKNTIKRMRLLFNSRKGGGLDVPISILPGGPIFGPCDTRGFSAARLKLSGDAWSGFDAMAPVRQMVPIGQKRTLRVRGTATTEVMFRLDSAKAEIVDQTSDSVTVIGRQEGEADLIIVIVGNRPTSVRLLVRKASTIPIDVVHLGRAVLASGLMISAQRSVATSVTRIYEAQANLTFSSGTSRIVDSVKSGSRTIVIDPNKPLVIRSDIGPPRATQELRFDDLKALVTRPKAITMFVSAQLFDASDPNISGRGELGNRILWFNPLKAGSANAAILPGHEIGHSLGMSHVTTKNNGGFLMNPTIQANNIIIPCETLVELQL